MRWIYKIVNWQLRNLSSPSPTKHIHITSRKPYSHTRCPDFLPSGRRSCMFFVGWEDPSSMDTGQKRSLRLHQPTLAAAISVCGWPQVQMNSFFLLFSFANRRCWLWAFIACVWTLSVIQQFFPTKVSWFPGWLPPKTFDVIF